MRSRPLITLLLLTIATLTLHTALGGQPSPNSIRDANGDPSRRPAHQDATGPRDERAVTKTSSDVTPPKQENDIADIYLNFEDASLASVVNYLAQRRNINIIPDKKLTGIKVSLTTREALTLTKAWNILLTLLEMNGFTIINVNNVYRIVPNKENQKEPLPFYSSNKGIEPENLPESDMVVRYVYVLKNISTDVAKRILDGILGPRKTNVNRELGTCIITDKCFNIKSAMKIVKELDVGGLRESIKIIQLKYTKANEVAKIFNEEIMGKQRAAHKGPIRIFGPQQKKEIAFFSKTTKIIPEERKNALILLGLEQNIDKIIDFINKNIDVPIGTAASRIHVKELKYVKASQLATKILTPMIRATQQEKFFGEDIVIETEDPSLGEEDRGSGNRLVIACNQDDWRRLEKLIDKLDKPQPQVALEVMIVDIDSEEKKRLGSQIRQKVGHKFVHGMHAFTSNLSETEIDSGAAEGSSASTKYEPNLINVAVGNSIQGSTVFTAGRAGDVWGVLKTFFSKADTNIVSQPFMVTSNNKKATFQTTLKKRVPGKIKTEGSMQVRDYEDVMADAILHLTPRINASGLIDLKVDIQLDEFLAIGEADKPSTSNRKIVTRTTMGTGEVLALGGLTKNKITTSHYKTPIFGDIPILGTLFRSRIKETKKTDLYIFIRPSIIRPHFEGGADEYTQLKIDYAKSQIIHAEELRHSKDPIQRWFFSPTKQKFKHSLSDLKKGIYRPIDRYVEGKKQPASVKIEIDPYFRAKEEIESKGKIQKAVAKRNAFMLPSLRNQRRARLRGNIPNKRLYLATRSPRAGAPALINAAPAPTAKSAINESFVSPER